MPRVTGPLMSVDARGTLADVLTYQGGVAGYRVGKKPTHRNMRSGLQVAQREVFLAARDEWGWLTAEEKAAYAAAAHPLKMTGYNRFLKRFLQGEERRYTRLLLPLQEGAGVVAADRSGYANNGAISGATWTQLPSGVWVLSFNGTSDYVNCGNAVSLQMNDQLSVSTWITLKRTAQYEYIVAKGYPWVGGWWFQKNLNTTSIIFVYVGPTNWWISTPLTLTLNTSAHLTYTFDGGVVRRYLNGAYIGSDTFADTTVAGTDITNLRLGSSPEGGYPLQGNLGNTRLYGRVLTDMEIAAIYSFERPYFSG